MAQVTRFEQVYSARQWQAGGVLSGDGSRIEKTGMLRDWLESQPDEGMKTVLDLGCGDLNWISQCDAVTSGALLYHGVDVVPAMIAHHRRVFPWFTGTAEDLEAFVRISADVVIVKDVLPHHCNGFAEQILLHVSLGSWRRLLITSHPGARNERRRGIHGARWVPYDIEAAMKADGQRILEGSPALRIPRPSGGEYQVWER